ncbi:unnamed protein product [Alopecurus aequalis]
MEEMLLRLPARSVIRFRAVCVSWAALLSSPAFLRDYAVVEAGARQTTKFLLFAPSPASPQAAATAVYSCRAGSQRTAEPLFTIDGLRPGFLLASSKPCHGLTLLADTRSLAQWVINASTGEHRRLPRRRYRGAWSAGLDYDDRAREHKVVQIFYSEGEDEDEDVELGCAVYTLGLGTPPTTGQWRPASGGVPEHLRSAVKCATIFEGTTTKVPPVLANGRLHWQLYPHSFNDDLFSPGVEHHSGHSVPVLCFSAADESLSVVAGPAVENIIEYCELNDLSPAVPLHLVELQGLLCMVRDLRHPIHRDSVLEVWALRDYSHSVWSLDYRVSLTPQVARDVYSPRFLTVLDCTRAGKILIATSEHKVHAYDPATGDVDTVLTVPEDVVGLQEEAVAGIRIGLYEDNFTRVGGESREQKEADSAMTQVLLRLPVKSIGICTLVCKQWCTLIESHNFVKSHMLANQGQKVMMVTKGRSDQNKIFGFMPLDTWRAGDPPRTIANGNIEHVVVEINRSAGGAHVCMVKASCAEYWSCAGAPPRPVTDMPPAHVDGVLYWMSEPQAASRDRVVVAFEIPTRAFSILPCQPSSTVHDEFDPFLVELQGVLSLVISNTEEDELHIWMMRQHATWFNAYKICLQNHPNFSLTEDAVIPLDLDSNSGRILLDAVRALGYYDTRTGTLDLLYSLDQLHLPRHNLAFPMLYVDSLVRIQDDELPDHVTQPLRNEGTRDEGESGKSRYIFRSCEKGGCNRPGAVYTGCCCRRVLCLECSSMCVEHNDGFHTTIPCNSPHSTNGNEGYYGLPHDHPSVPDSEYSYYNSEMAEQDGQLGSHIFVSLKDLARGRQPHRLVECGYRTDGKVITSTWVRRYRQ